MKCILYHEFCNDDKTVDATVFAISQIGELVKNDYKLRKNRK